MSERRRQTAILQKAVALKYDEVKRDAPEVVASGRGRIAEQIIALAKAHGVVIKQDPDLVEVLAKLDIGEMIPTELYALVAEILVFVYRVNAKHQPLRTSPRPSSQVITRRKSA